MSYLQFNTKFLNATADVKIVDATKAKLLSQQREKLGIHCYENWTACGTTVCNFVSRFFIAGLVMVFVTHGIKRNRMPAKSEWKQLMIFGLLNISIYLGLYIIAMQNVSAGLGSLCIAVNPVMISFISAGLFGHRIARINIVILALCIAGVGLAALPLLKNSYATAGGVLLMTASMLAYSLGTIYFTKKKWGNLHILTINGWQTILGGIFLLPLLLLTYKHQQNSFDINFWGATFWLAGPVSIGAVLCCLQLLKINASSASYWLFFARYLGFVFQISYCTNQ